MISEDATFVVDSMGTGGCITAIAAKRQSMIAKAKELAIAKAKGRALAVTKALMANIIKPYTCYSL